MSLTISLTILYVLFGFAATAVGALAALWFCWSHFRGSAQRASTAKARHAVEVLIRLQELMTRVAVDVDQHSSQVEHINEKLASVDTDKPNVIVDVVAKLIQANQQMQKKLTSTEDKLRKQAQEIQIHTVEARTDAITLLANRRAFDDELVRSVAEFRRLGRTFSLIMADVDHFKKFNDTHGHQVGDFVLQGIAKLLRRTMREMDLVARYGGEEYAIILPGTILDHACKAALRACETIQKHNFQHDTKGGLRVTMSFGVAEVLTNEEGASLIRRVDKALYAAKEGGRNCVYQYDGQTIHRFDPDKQPILTETKEQPKSESITAMQEIKQDPEAPPEDQSARPSPEPACAAELDVVSAIPSRTNFCQQVRNRLAEIKRGGPTFSIVLIEVSQYDEDEKHGGQLSNELATLTAAKYLTTTVRGMDVVGHYAPGCFGLLLPMAGLIDSIRVAERLREEFSQYILSTQGEQPRLTLSIGVVQVMEMDEFISLMKRAEEALDTAVRRGSNRTYYHDGKRCAPITAMLETMDYLS